MFEVTQFALDSRAMWHLVGHITPLPDTRRPVTPRIAIPSRSSPENEHLLAIGRDFRPRSETNKAASDEPEAALFPGD